jgi:exopolyphosphatase/guanosine-5'-triphosphate,3'-diphosphate pyrophosphatase
MGCVSYTQRFFKDGAIKSKQFDKAITAAEQELELIEEKYRKMGWTACIGTSGTIRTLVSLCQDGQESAESAITLKQLKQLKKQCVEAGHCDALSFAQLSDDRRPVLCAGLAILIAIFQALRIESLRFSPAALREGVLYQMEDALEHADIRERTATSLVTRYDVDTHQALLVLDTCNLLYDTVKKSWRLSDNGERNVLSWAAMLHEVGMQINSRGIQRHSAYILQNVDMPGFNQEEQELLATLVRFQRKKIRLAEFPEFSQFDPDNVIKLICILRLAVLLNVKRQEKAVPEMNIEAHKKTLSIAFPAGWLDSKPIMAADLIREQEHITALGLTLTIDQH